jgi:hypothetical protein
MKSNERPSKMVAFTWHWSLELWIPEWQKEGGKGMDGLWYIHVFRKQEDDQAVPSHYRIVRSKLTLVFMEFEIRQFASAFSISSLALAASAFAESGAETPGQLLRLKR